MENYKINGKPISMPTGWHDVKYTDACNILENELNTVQVFALFSGIPEKEVEKLNKQDDIYYFLRGFPFLNRLPFEDEPSIPRSILYKGERVIFPHVLLNDPLDFGEMAVGQIEDMKALADNMIKEILNGEERSLTNGELLKIYPYVVAIYLQPIIEKEYKYKRALKLAKEIPDVMSFKEVVYMGNFFLLKLGNSMNGLKMGFLHQAWIVRKLKQAYKILVNYLDSTLP